MNTINTIERLEPPTTNCQYCKNPFIYRKSKKFCCSNCRVYACRPKQNSQCSPAKRRKNLMLYDTAMRLAEMLYSLPPHQRLGYMKTLIDKARAGDTKLRDILSNHTLRHPDPIKDRWLFYRGSRNYCTIAQAAQNYCKRFWHEDISDVVYCRCPEPPTGEVTS